MDIQRKVWEDFFVTPYILNRACNSFPTIDPLTNETVVTVVTVMKCRIGGKSYPGLTV